MPRPKQVELFSATSAERPRLRRLHIQNLGCIGAEGVTIDLDEIVVLIGPNNAGKSTILRAFELVMSEGSKLAQLEASDFPNGTVDTSQLPTIELDTVVFDRSPGARWLDESSGEVVVRERWVWSEPSTNPKRFGYDVEKKEWVNEVPYGAANVANFHRPLPHRVDAFAPPDAIAEQITNLLLSGLKDKLKQLPTEMEDESGAKVRSKYGELLDAFAKIQQDVVKESQQEIIKAEQELSVFLSTLFPGYKVNFKANAEDTPDKSLQFFKSGAQLSMGPVDGFATPVGKQGGGARRALLWAAVRWQKEASKRQVSERPHVLLLDEPELCLHPNVIREASRLLYSLPQTRKWQVMVTTHSPLFVDLSRDNTTVVRVEREASVVSTTTLFRPADVTLDADEKAELKLLNLCEPYFCEFFFGGRTILVEGDTEYSAFQYIRSLDFETFKDFHVVRARGKATIALLARIVNKYGGRYAILHDSDRPTALREGKTIVNPAWTSNELIRNVAAQARAGRVRLVSSLVNFEAAMFNSEATKEKPYNTLVRLKESAPHREKCAELFAALGDFATALPIGFSEWETLDQLKGMLEPPNS